MANRCRGAEAVMFSCVPYFYSTLKASCVDSHHTYSSH